MMTVLRVSNTFACLQALIPQPNGTSLNTAVTSVKDNSSTAGSTARVMVCVTGAGDYYYAEFTFGSASVGAVLKIGKRVSGSDTVLKTVSLGTGTAFRCGQTVTLGLCVGADRSFLQASVNNQVVFSGSGSLIVFTAVPSGLPYIGIGTGGTVNTSLDFSGSSAVATDIDGCDPCYTNCVSCTNSKVAGYVDVTVPNVFTNGVIAIHDSNRNNFTSQIASPIRCYLNDPEAALATGAQWYYKFPGTEPFGVPGFWHDLWVYCAKAVGARAEIHVQLNGIDFWSTFSGTYNRKIQFHWLFKTPTTAVDLPLPTLCDESAGPYTMCCGTAIFELGFAADYVDMDGVPANSITPAIGAANSPIQLEFGPAL
jgi:hypothetical protein